MSGPDDSRRAFLAGGTVIAAGAAFVSDASAQSKMVINDPSVVREIEAEFAGYDRALGNNDVAALNGFFFDSPFTIRYGNDFATVSTLSRRPQSGKVGRTMQTWVRFPQGWRIVAAHVSTIDDPAKP